MAEEGDAAASLATESKGADGDAGSEDAEGMGETTAAGTSPGNATSPSEVDALAAEDGAVASPAVVEETKEDVPESPLSFAQHMWERFEFLWHSRVEPSERLLEQTAAVLRARAELERRYAERLGSIAGQVNMGESQIASAPSVCNAVDAVMVNFRNRGEQSVTLADQIEQDIVITFEEVVAQHREVSRKMKSDVELLTRYCADTRKNHSKAAQRYGNRCLEAESLANEVLQGLAMKVAERTQAAMKVVTLSLQARQAELEYYNTIGQANKAAELYEQHLPTVLSKLQEMEEKRHLCLRDGLRKLAVYEMSWLRNMQYDLEATVKASEGADPAVDLQTFLRDSWKAQGRRPPSEGASVKPPFGALHFGQLGRLKVPKETPERQQARKDDLTIRQFIAEYQPLMKRIVSGEDATPAVGSGAPPEGLSGVDGVSQPTPLDILRSGLHDARRRAAICQVLRGEIMTVQEQANVEIDHAKPVTVPASALDALAAILDQALSCCDDQADCWNGRELMVFADKFRAEMDTGKTVSLLTRIYSHRIWSKVTFWEEVLLVGLCEAHAAEVIWRRSLAPGSKFDQPAMTAFLHRFVAHMLNFGIRQEQAKSAVIATLQKQQLLLGRSTDIYKKLILQAYESPAPQPGPTIPAASAASSARPANEVSTQVSTSMPNGEPSAPMANGNGEHATSSAEASEATEAATAQAPEAQDEEEEEDDFEAVALGLPAESSVGAQSNPGEAEDPGSPGDQALKNLEGQQRSVNDVFGD